MEKWVNGLRAAKEFWAHYKRQEVKLKIRQSPSPHEDVVSVHDEVPKLVSNDLQIIFFCLLLGDLRLEEKYKIEYKYDFLN